MNISLPIQTDLILSPADQFASRKRLNAKFRPHLAMPKLVIKLRSKPAFIENPKAPRCRWPRRGTHFQPIISGTVGEIIRTVAYFYNLTPEEMLTRQRRYCFVKPRQVAIYLSRVIAKKSFPDIGLRFGGMDHSTIIHACHAVRKRLADDPNFVRELASLSQQVEARA